MPTQKLQSYLEKNQVKYTSIPHPVAYSAQEVCHCCHIAETQLAKTVIVNVGGKKAMVVLPARYALNFDSLKKSLHADVISLASEAEIRPLFTDCEVGAMPPFGNLYNIDVYVDNSLGNNKEIVFNAGTHSEAIKLAYQDFIKLVKPTIIKAH